MPKSKSGRKKQKKRSQKRSRPSRQKTPNSASNKNYQAPASALDQPLAIASAIIPLATAVFLSSTAEPTGLLNFSLVFTIILTSLYLGASWLIVSDIDKGSSVLELKQSLNKGQVTSAHLRLAHLSRAWLLGLLGLGAFVTAALVPLAPYPLTLIGATALLGTGLRLLPVRNTRHVVLQSLNIVVFCCVMALIGVYSQTLIIKHPLMLLGLAPGTVLAASLVPKFSQLFSAAKWQRCKPHVNKKGKEIRRPGGSTNLYSGLLFLGPTTVFILASAQVIPSWFMLTAVIFISGPGLATAFRDETQPDASLTKRTLNQALLMNVAVLVAGALIKF